MTKEDKIKGFKKWCETNTATFESVRGEDGWCEEYNVTWKELSFYDELIKKVEEIIK